MMFRKIPSLLIAVFGVVALGSICRAQDIPLRPQIIHTKFPTEDCVIATAVATAAPFNAPTDGTTDATTAIQSAIDAVAKIGGGVVYLPAGRYLCAGSILVKEGVTLRGDWRAPTSGLNGLAVEGTILMPTGGRGQADGAPFLDLQRGTGIRNASIWYPEQSASNVVPYPWTISGDQVVTGQATIEQVTLVNPYRGIHFGPAFTFLSTMREVYGTPLNTGISIDSTADISRMEMVRLSPDYWLGSGLGSKPDASALRAYIRSSGTGVELLRTDWEYIFRVAVEGYNIGFHLHQSPTGAPSGVMYGSSAVGGDVGLKVEGLDVGYQFANSRFDGATAGVWTTPPFGTEIQLNNCVIGGRAQYGLRLQGTGSVRLANCTVMKSGSIDVAASHGFLTMLATTLQGVGKKIALQPGVRRALILDSAAPSSVINTSGGDVQIDNRPIVVTKPSADNLVLLPDRKPAKDQLFDVVDYGAVANGDDAATASDNTAAFQKALDIAGAAGGGTVYVPAGTYRFYGDLSVPTGVELRGCFDVPHHSQSWGSVLMPMGGRGEENGTPFISLAKRSGARGLLIYYPDQKEDNIVPYPWTVQSKGPGCWLVDFSAANTYQYVDFGSYPSEGHLLRYVAGAPLRRGIWVSKGSGDVDECMFNGHYWAFHSPRAPALASNPSVPSPEQLSFAYSQQYLDAFTFGSCPHETMLDNFVYADAIGFRYVPDAGKACSGTAINQGSDGCSIGLSAESVDPAGINLFNTEIAVVGAFTKTPLQVTASNRGPVNLFNGLTWGQTNMPSMLLMGKGSTIIQNWGSHQEEIHASGNDITLQGMSLESPVDKNFVADGPLNRLTVQGNSAARDTFRFDHAATTVAAANGRALTIAPLVDVFKTAFEPSDPQPSIQKLMGQMTSTDCVVDAHAGLNGKAGLVLTGTPLPPNQHSYTYYKIFDVNIPVNAYTELRYMLLPGTTAGITSGIDLVFADGSNLRDSSLVDVDGRGVHPAVAKGRVGHWTSIDIDLETQEAGKVIKQIMFAYDAQIGNGPVKSTLNNIEIGEPKH